MFSALKSKLRRLLLTVYQNDNARTQLMLHAKLEELQSHPRYDDPKCLMRHGYKIYSQCEEDGIIAEIFHRIGTTNKTFVEFGIGDGLENNSLALLFQGWKGLWIEGSGKAVNAINEHFSPVINAGDLIVENAFLTKDSIDPIIARHIEDEEIDFLSVDTDGNDWHLYEAIKCINPRVVVFEYNAKFTPPVRFCMDYDATYVRANDDCFGFSLSFIVDKMTPRGYSLVSCNLSGANAFFVRNDLLEDHFVSDHSAEFHYEPARYYLVQYNSGHASSYQSLRRSLTMR